MKFIHLIEEKKEDFWINQKDHSQFFRYVGAPCGPIEHLQMIKEKNGEKIVLVSDNNQILGWIEIIPGLDSKKQLSAELTGIEVDIHLKGKGLGTRILNYAKQYLLKKSIKYFIFQTTPLYTANAGLYITHFFTEYTWHPDILMQDGLLWPLVDCKMDLTKAPLKIRINDKNSIKRESLLFWDGLDAKRNKINMNNRYIPLVLPSINAELIINELKKKNTEFIKTCYEAFDLLDKKGYKYYWFNKLDENKKFYYYLFKK